MIPFLLQVIQKLENVVFTVIAWNLIVYCRLFCRVLDGIDHGSMHITELHHLNEALRFTSIEFRFENGIGWTVIKQSSPACVSRLVSAPGP